MDQGKRPGSDVLRGFGGLDSSLPQARSSIAPEVGKLPLGSRDFGQPDRRFDSFDLAEDGYLSREWVTPPMLEQALGRGCYETFGATGQILAIVNMTLNFVDDGIVVIGFKIEAALRSGAFLFRLWHRNDELRGSRTGGYPCSSRGSGSVWQVQ